MKPNLTVRVLIAGCAVLLAMPALGETIDVSLFTPHYEGENGSTYLIDLVDVLGNRVYGDTLTFHLQTQVIGSSVDYSDGIRFEIDGVDQNDVPRAVGYQTGDDAVQDVGVLHDSIYVAGLPFEISQIIIYLQAPGGHPRMLDGSWVEISMADRRVEVVSEEGKYSYYPTNGEAHEDYGDPGESGFCDSCTGGPNDPSFCDQCAWGSEEGTFAQLGQAWAIAHGYHWSLRARSDLQIYNMKHFSPSDTVAEGRKADIHMDVSWLGTADKNSVSPVGVANWGYYVGAGLSPNRPPNSYVLEHKLAQKGEHVGMDYLSTIQDTLVSAAVGQVVGDVAEEVVGEAVPGIGEILAIIEFTKALLTVDEFTGGSRRVMFRDVILDKNVAYYPYVTVAAIARAGGAASAYVNFMYNGDPFVPTSDKVNEMQRGVWLHDVIVYYQPVDMVQVELDKPSQHVYGEASSFPTLDAEIVDGSPPYSWRWYAVKSVVDDDGVTLPPEVSPLPAYDEDNYSKTASITPTHTDLPEFGTYLIKVEVTDAEGSVDTESWDVEVVEPPAPFTISHHPDGVDATAVYKIWWDDVPRAHTYALEEAGPIDSPTQPDPSACTDWTALPRQTWPFETFSHEEVGWYCYRATAYDLLDQSSTSNVELIRVQNPLDDEIAIRPIRPRVGSAPEEWFWVEWEKGNATQGYFLREYLVPGDSLDPDGDRVESPDSPYEYTGCENEYTEAGTGIAMCRDSFSHTVTESLIAEYVVERGTPGNPVPDSMSEKVGTEIVPPPTGTTLVHPITNSTGAGDLYPLRWRANVPGAEEYEIQEALDIDFTTGLRTLVGSDAGVMWIDQDNAGAYFYRIRARNIGGISPSWSETVIKQVTTGSAPVMPVVRASRAEVDAGEEYVLEWGHVDHEGSYELVECADSGGCQSWFFWPLTSEWTRQTTQHSPTVTTTYSYSVRGWNLSSAPGWGDWSLPVDVLVVGTDAPDSPFLHDGGPSVRAGRTYDITWDAIDGADPGDTLIIEESADPSFPPGSQPYGSMPADTTSLAAVHGPISQNPTATTTYYYRLKVEIDGNWSGWSNIVPKVVRVIDCDALGIAPPEPPTGLETTPSAAYENDSFVVSWDAVGGPIEVDEYELQEDLGAGPGGPGCDFYSPNSVITAETSAQRDMYYGGAGGICYRVRAIGECDSDWSPVIHIGCPTVYLDEDGDNFGGNQSITDQCTALDGYVLVGGDCDDLNPFVHPGAPQICDGLNNNCSDPDWPTPDGDEVDQDGDTFSVCAGDCDEGRASVHPGAPPVCDDLNNDCNDPAWPALTGNEMDDDGDGYTECAGDCDDTSDDTHPEAGETNDGVDNNCAGDHGFGLVDELSGDVVHDGSRVLVWPAQDLATVYQVARSIGTPDFAGGCSTHETAATSWDDTTPLGPGEVAHYLVRPVAPHVGSWGRDTAGVERLLACGAELYCDNGSDEDGDGLTDCADPECFGQTGCTAESLCADGQDNDLDGPVDCADPDCFGRTGCTVEALCGDGQDNDDDGGADCADSDCFGGPDCTIETVCDDGQDNDLDGPVDCLDNDCDGLSGGLGNCELGTEQSCNDLFDNDADGQLDCLDADCAGSEGCAVTTVVSNKDNSIYEDSEHLSNAGGSIKVGNCGLFPTYRVRGLVAFDLTATIPPGATVYDVKLRLYQSDFTLQSSNVSIYRLLQDWGEGTSSAGDPCDGAPATANDATWLYRFYNPGSPSSSPSWPAGGDFASPASAVISVGNTGHYTWSSAQMVADVQSWVDDPATNFGWMFATGSYSKTFRSRESANQTYRPRLEITYGVAPLEPLELPPKADAYLDAYSSTGNFGARGYMKERSGVGLPNNEVSAILRFDLASIPSGSTIASATLHLNYYYYKPENGNPAGRVLRSHRVLDPWGEMSVTWNNRPAWVAASTSQSVVPSSYGWMSWDLTSDVQSMVDGTYTNQGWTIRDESSGGYPLYRFRSREAVADQPYLEITFE